MPNLDSGTVLTGKHDRYRLARQIGRGGIGEVWSGTALQSGDRVAVKVLSEHRFDLTDAVFERFLREIRYGSRLTHSNLVRTLDCDASDRPVFLVMELVNGKPLSNLVGTLGAEARRRVAEGLISGLRSLHELGLVHRDLKTNNVLVTENHLAKICDYGLLKSAQQDLFLTDSTDRLGSLLYLSSHQLAKPALADEKDDIYSLLACLFELFSGRRMSIRWQSAPLAFGSAKLQQLIRGVLSEDTPRDVWPSLDEVRALVTERRTMLPFASDGRRTVVGVHQGVRLYDSDSPPQWSPDGHNLAIWGSHGDSGLWVHLWDATAMRHRGSLCVSAENESAGTLSWSRLGERLAASCRGSVALFSVQDFRYLFSALSIAVYDNIALSPDGRRLCWGNVFGAVTLMDTATGEELHNAMLHSGAASLSLGISWSPNGESVVVQAGSGAMQWWSAKNGGIIRDLASSGPNEPDVRCPVHWVSDDIIAVATGRGGLQVRSKDGYVHSDLVANENVRDPYEPRPATLMTGRGAQLAFFSGDTVQIWDGIGGKRLSEFQVGTVCQWWSRSEVSLSYSPCGSLMGVVSCANIQLWDISDPAAPFMVGIRDKVDPAQRALILGWDGLRVWAMVDGSRLVRLGRDGCLEVLLLARQKDGFAVSLGAGGILVSGESQWLLNVTDFTAVRFHSSVSETVEFRGEAAETEELCRISGTGSTFSPAASARR